MTRWATSTKSETLFDNQQVTLNLANVASSRISSFWIGVLFFLRFQNLKHKNNSVRKQSVYTLMLAVFVSMPAN